MDDHDLLMRGVGLEQADAMLHEIWPLMTETCQAEFHEFDTVWKRALDREDHEAINACTDFFVSTVTLMWKNRATEWPFDIRVCTIVREAHPDLFQKPTPPTRS